MQPSPPQPSFFLSKAIPIDKNDELKCLSHSQPLLLNFTLSGAKEVEFIQFTFPLSQHAWGDSVSEVLKSVDDFLEAEYGLQVIFVCRFVSPPPFRQLLPGPPLQALFHADNE